MRCTPLIESQNLGKMSVPLKAHKRERRGEGAGRERNEESEQAKEEILNCDKSQCDS